MTKLAEIILEQVPFDIFTHSDLENLLGKGLNRRYGLVKRAISKGDIIHIRQGLYCLCPKYQRHKLNLYQLAQKIYGPSYVSLESSLSYHGWIPESVYCTTNTSIKKSKDFSTPLGSFIYKRIPSKVFYLGVERIEDPKAGAFLMARPFKALIDYIYVYKKDWKNIEPAVESLRIEINTVKKINSDELNMLYQNYRSIRIRKFISGVKKGLGYEC